MKFSEYNLYNIYEKCVNRINNIIFYVFILFLLLLIKIYNIQINNYELYNLKSYKNCTRLVYINPIRGLILDRNNKILASNKIIYNIELIPDRVNNIKKEIKKLSKIIKINKNEIKSFYNRLKKSYTSNPIIIKHKLNKSELNRFIVRKIEFPNFNINIEYKRYYPYKNLFSHIIGYVSLIDKYSLNNNKNNYNKNSYIGKMGLEKYYENILRGKFGIKEIEINNRGKFVRFKNKIMPINGNNIRTTLDFKLQNFSYNLMKKYKGSLIISDVNDGSILSMISSPSFNPNLFIYKNNSIKNLLNNKNYPILNRSIQGIYPPASTIKPYIGLLALYNNIINLNSLFYDPGWWKIPNSNNIYNDWNKNGRGWINIIKAIEESSDVYFYNIAYLIGIDKINKFMSYFGFNKKTNIDLPNEKIGILPSKEWKIKKIKKKWYIGDTISAGIGQGYFSVTPIQMLNALLILVNNGINKKLHIIKNKNIINNNNLKNIININDNIWNIIKFSMYNVAHSKNGTANSSFNNSKYKIACKTGTAQVFSLRNKKYFNNIVPKELRDHRLIIGFGPFNNPKIAIVLILENIGNEINPGDILRKIFDFILIKNNYNVNNEFLQNKK
ncbi:penicillin-binding protein 2 [Candidatus Nardonella dryophthoridicola]|uniref:penicillin-binding protein 2 n=1 Tax=Candidatus Nardonella dryophthoridicola TaxID=1971485 RepID=UPI001AD8624C|nr:penicillin-binding protein 2 [Candidatus Nardonella dryophthoridicola]QTJ62798.1 penicillin-binding protein 2 [Candidatus Nardonella dryophthoridicola]